MHSHRIHLGHLQSVTATRQGHSTVFESFKEAKRRRNNESRESLSAAFGRNQKKRTQRRGGAEKNGIKTCSELCVSA